MNALAAILAADLADALAQGRDAKAAAILLRLRALRAAVPSN